MRTAAVDMSCDDLAELEKDLIDEAGGKELCEKGMDQAFLKIMGG